ncbi:MAG: methyltransferase domain-containing protein [Pseudomonadota bacterium]
MSETAPQRIHDTEALNARLQAIIARVRVDLSFLHDDHSRAHVAAAVAGAERVLDVGAGMRGALSGFPGTLETLDINDVEDNANLFRPTLLGDVCSPFPDWMAARYDAVIALAILEHVYDPPAAIANFHAALRPGGRLFLYVPWIYRYHAPPSLIFQDYQRMSRDGLAYALRDFEGVTLYPIRGKYSAMANLAKWWKTGLERRLGTRLNRLLDARVSDWRNTIQASGYFVEARKPGGAA